MSINLKDLKVDLGKLENSKCKTNNNLTDNEKELNLFSEEVVVDGIQQSFMDIPEVNNIVKTTSIKKESTDKKDKTDKIDKKGKENKKEEKKEKVLTGNEKILEEMKKADSVIIKAYGNELYRVTKENGLDTITLDQITAALINNFDLQEFIDGCTFHYVSNKNNVGYLTPFPKFKNKG